MNLVESCCGSNLSDGKQNVIPYVNNPRTTARSSEKLWSTDKDMIPARNATDGNAGNCVTNDKMLLSIFKAFAHCNGSLHATGNA